MEIFKISNEWDIGQVRRYIAERSKINGFSQVEVGEISIVVSELCTNLIKHNSIEGKIIFREIEEQEKIGIEIISEDKGPGIVNVDQAMKDGVSSRGTMGGGLGAVKRLMDTFELYSKTNMNTENPRRYGHLLGDHGVGTIIITQKWIKNSLNTGGQEINISVISRPYPGNKVNGDAYYIKEGNNKVIIALIDGLGHGIGAHEAANTAKKLIEENNYKNLQELLLSIDKGMKGSRGAVIGMCIINKDTQSFQYGSIGNVELRYIINNKTQKFIASNGTLGISLNNRFKIQESSYEKGGILVMNTDGISNKWEYNDYKAIPLSNPGFLSNMIFRHFARNNDDATVLVAVI
jgi:anti-sigma regulatory factor (Ser/Thr protein kinase)